MKGRKPVPSILRALRNNPSKRPFNVLEPQPSALSTACPLDLIDPVAQEEWARTIVPVITRGQITADDRIAAIVHCELWATYRSQVAEALKHPHVIAVGGHPMPNPVRTAANKT